MLLSTFKNIQKSRVEFTALRSYFYTPILAAMSGIEDLTVSDPLIRGNMRSLAAKVAEPYIPREADCIFAHAKAILAYLTESKR